MHDEKYIVFKRRDWEQANAAGVEHQVKPVEDAVVIRLQDSFATSGLWAYAHNIRTYLELVKPDWDLRDKALIAEEYFVARATEAQQMLELGKTKIPD